MLKPKTDIEWIDGFLRGELSESEVVTFQKKLTTDNAFVSLFEEQQLLVTGIRLDRLNSKASHFQKLGKSLNREVDEVTIEKAIRHKKNLGILNRFKERGKELDKKSTISNRKINFNSYLFNRFTAAAAVLLLLVTFWWTRENYSTHAIANNSIELPLSNKSMSNVTKNDIDLGKEAYFSKNYELAQKIFDGIPLDNKDYFEAQVLLAYNLFGQEEYDESITQFNKLIEKYFASLPNIYKDENKLRWNRLMVYVGKNKMKSPFFQQELQFFLNSKSNFYRKKAAQLNNDLNNSWRFMVIE